MLQDRCQHNAPWCLPSQISKASLTKKLHDPCQHNVPLHFSSQCSMTPIITTFSAHFITMFLVTFNHNAPCPFITMLQNYCHRNVPWPCHQKAPWPLSSQWSMTPFLRVLQYPFHHNAPCHCQHKAPWTLSSKCSFPFSSQCSRYPITTMLPSRVNTMLHDPCHQNALWTL